MNNSQGDSIWEAAQRKEIRHAAEEFGLQPRSVAYVVIKQHKATSDPAKDPWSLSRLLDYLKWEKSQKPDWDDPSGARQHEFAKKELARKLNGQITGE